ncbi:ABC transporter substrate-binding protein [Methylocella silvestris]|uniref:Branched-chain amino acid ABC transporter substrate-binding protein n=1 Tax=Methylocella silvestris TaxID=199596 RepID=A0A2J7TDQ8_METSI|nr:ABC transporter substrate-binding protein [Methylocella silvestris]PNG24900.1 branched-chain amino acid ABC transporter substrate-binding protein [Methylocella silvestris]
MSSIHAKGPPIPIGSMVPLSGPSAADGAEFRKGVVLATEEVNARGGVQGRPLHPIFVDTRHQSAEEVVAAACKLIEVDKVHAIINGYNIGAQNSEYEPIANAGIIYIHHNTLLQHHDTVLSDPERYFGCFMADPADYWYGQGFIKFISWLRDTAQWKAPSNRIAIVSGSKPYSIVIANAMAAAAAQFGWNVAFGPHVVATPTTNWRAVLKMVRAVEPAVIANTHFYSGDLAHFQLQFMENPTNSIVYLQYGAMHQSFIDIAQAKAAGVIVSTVVGLLRDDMGQRFARRYIQRFGEGSTPQVGCQSYIAVHHYAIATAIAGGSGGPGEFEQNHAVARALRETIYRSVAGTIRYHPKWQAAMPYPDYVLDPSLGLPHLFYQIQDWKNGPLALIAPEPYNTEHFVLPPWIQTSS